MKLELNHNYHSHIKGNDGYEVCLACSDDSQSKLTAKQIVNWLEQGCNEHWGYPKPFHYRYQCSDCILELHKVIE